MTLAAAPAGESPPVAAPLAPPAAGGGRVRRGDLVAALGLLPFATVITLFLLVPTGVVVVGALSSDGRPSLDGLSAFGDPVVLRAFARSTWLAASTAVIGAVAGAVLAHAVASGAPDGIVRRVATSACGVLAQFGGVTLAFAFVATLGVSGVVTLGLQDLLGLDVFARGVWLFDMPGLVLVYTFFQVPLMVIVFLPALDGMRPQWREATLTLGGSTWQFWRHVGLPLLAPAFGASTLLLFANALSAYATAAALVSQGAPIVPLQIRAALTSEVLLGRADLGQVLALGLIVLVVVALAGQAALTRRTSRWAEVER